MSPLICNDAPSSTHRHFYFTDKMTIFSSLICNSSPSSSHRHFYFTDKMTIFSSLICNALIIFNTIQWKTDRIGPNKKIYAVHPRRGAPYIKNLEIGIFLTYIYITYRSRCRLYERMLCNTCKHSLTCWQLQPALLPDERSAHGTVNMIHSPDQSCGRTQQKKDLHRAHHRYQREGSNLPAYQA